MKLIPKYSEKDLKTPMLYWKFSKNYDTMNAEWNFSKICSDKQEILCCYVQGQLSVFERVLVKAKFLDSYCHGSQISAVILAI
jgi:hypothetical protein